MSKPRRLYSVVDREVRFLRHVNKTKTCWLWTGAVSTKGRGVFSWNPGQILAHRFFFGGPGSSLRLRHLCAVLLCVNPKHYEIVKTKERERIDAKAEVLRRFWDSVGPEDKNGCWPWIGHVGKTGYGVINRRRLGIMNRGAHRAAYELLVGEIPDGMWVLHSCDNPPCVNPKHLRIGTPKDNSRDRDERGRSNYDFFRKRNPRKKVVAS